MIFIVIGGGLLIYGALEVTRWLEPSGDDTYMSLSFLGRVIAPLLGGALLVLIGMMEWF